MSARRIILVLGVLACATPGLRAGAYEETVRPVLEHRCIACHGETVTNAGVRLDNLPVNFLEDRRATETWHDVLNALNRGEMPPKAAPQLTADERTAVVDWLTLNFAELEY